MPIRGVSAGRYANSAALLSILKTYLQGGRHSHEAGIYREIPGHQVSAAKMTIYFPLDQKF